MIFTGVLKKMKTELAAEVQYFMEMKNDILHVNQLLDRDLTLQFKGYQCLSCGKDKRIFRQGYCYDCFFQSPQTGEWIMKPELSTAHLNVEDRDLKYEKSVQLQPHVVYLANSSTIKVGVTRKTQIPYRWIDQGAHEAIPILETPNRYLAGISEVALKDHISDKTNWRSMLQNKVEEADLFEIKEKLQQYIPEEAKDYFIKDPIKMEINFPVRQYPKKLNSLNFKKEIIEYSGVLKGIKGQYLIFEDNTVFNVRANSGYIVAIDVR